MANSHTYSHSHSTFNATGALSESEFTGAWLWPSLGALVSIILVLVLAKFEKSNLVQRIYSLISSIESEETSPVTPNPKDEGKLVYLAGNVSTKETLQDYDFNIVVTDSLRLRRSVEMLQWEQVHHTKTHKDKDGKETTEHYYTYRKVWSSVHINSMFFESPSYYNPNNLIIKETSAKVNRECVKFGEMLLSESLYEEMMNHEQSVQVTHMPKLSEFMNGALFGSRTFDRMEPRGDYIYLLPPSFFGFEEVGTVRIAFYRVPTGDVSICSQQKGNSFKKHDFMKDESNFRSKILGQAVNERRKDFNPWFRFTLLGDSDLDAPFEVLKRGIYTKDSFFKANIDDLESKKIWLDILLHVGLAASLTLFFYWIFPKPWYMNAIEGTLLALIFGFTTMGLVKYAVEPNTLENHKKVVLAAAFTFVGEQILYYSMLNNRLMK